MLSQKHGFIDCGIAVARRLDEEEEHLREWLGEGYQGKMVYMENHFEKRLDPTLLVPGVKSVISFLYNYFPVEKQKDGVPKIAKYAYGEDYHRVIKDKLYELVAELEVTTGKINGRIFVDSAPVMERQWAALSGLGWIGKNSLLLRKNTGSFFFIATIICDLELEPDSPVTDHCGTCTACIDACPTQAIVANGVIDASKCISYLTIELKEPIPQEFKGNTDGWIFGCDICQDVCPWNRFSSETHEERFAADNDLINRSSEAWMKMNPEEFEVNFNHSAMKRAGLQKIQDSINFNRKSQ